jgi:hypothetical protein
MDNTQVWIVDKNSRLQPIGVPGELRIGGICLARGYLNRPELTAEKFNMFYTSNRSHIFYKTGDLARWLPDGNIELFGRIDTQVKIRGFRVELGEIESRLSTYNGIRDVAVAVGERENGDKYLCAYFVSDKEMDASELREYLSSTLPAYMIPSYFMRLDRIPLTSNGKVDRRNLPAPEVRATNRYEAPSTDLEKITAEAWMEVLNLDKVGVNDNFFELGGNSFNVIRLNSKLNHLLNKEIPVVSMFEHVTIRSFVEYVNREEKGERISVEEMDRKDLQDKGKLKKAMQRARRKGGRSNE